MQIEATNLYIDTYESRNGLLAECWQDLEDSRGPVVTITHDKEGWLVVVRGPDAGCVKVRLHDGDEMIVQEPLIYDDEADLESFASEGFGPLA
jgi:hypothetical protein